MSQAVISYSTALRDLQAEALTSAMMAKLFPRWRGDATDPAVARAPKRGPTPTAARALVLA